MSVKLYLSIRDEYFDLFNGSVVGLTLSNTNHTVLVMRRFGLTLIELLVVIGILAILITVLTPAIRKSKLQAKAIVCASNVRQINIALFAYADDKGKFPYGLYIQDINANSPPPEGGYSGYAQYDKQGWWWFNYLKELYKKSMGKRTILECPSKNIQYPKLESDILCGNYGVNLSICKMPKSQGNPNQAEFLGEPQTGTEIRRPSQTLLLLDSGYAIISWWHAADISPVSLGNSKIEDTAYVPGLKINKNRLLWQGGIQKYDALLGRHPRKTINIGYLDGHTARINADDLLVEKTSEGYKNLAPLWRTK